MRVPEVAGSTADAPSPGTLKFRLARRAEGEVPTVEWLGESPTPRTVCSPFPSAPWHPAR